MTNKADADATLAKLRQRWEANERRQYDEWFNSHMAATERAGREMTATFEKWAREDGERKAKRGTAPHTAPMFVNNREADELREMLRANQEQQQAIAEQLATIAAKKTPKRIRSSSGRTYTVETDGDDEMVVTRDRTVDEQASEQVRTAAIERALAALDENQRKLADLEQAEATQATQARQAEEAAADRQRQADEAEREAEQQRIEQARELL